MVGSRRWRGIRPSFARQPGAVAAPTRVSIHARAAQAAFSARRRISAITLHGHGHLSPIAVEVPAEQFTCTPNGPRFDCARPPPSPRDLCHAARRRPHRGRSGRPSSHAESGCRFSKGPSKKNQRSPRLAGETRLYHPTRVRSSSGRCPAHGTFISAHDAALVGAGVWRIGN